MKPASSVKDRPVTHVPLYAAPGRNSYEQLLKRAHMEALNSDATYIDINHLTGALIGHPNGPVRFALAQAMREEDVSEIKVRQLLGLGPFEPVEILFLYSNPRLYSPILDQVFLKADTIPGDSRVNSLLLALLDSVSKEHSVSELTPAKHLILSIKNGKLKGV